MEIYSGRKSEDKAQPRERKFNLFWVLVFLILAYLGYRFFWSSEKDGIRAVENPKTEEVSQAVPENKWDREEICAIAEGDIPAEVFSRFGNLDANDTARLLEAAKNVYDFSKLKIGQHVHFYFDAEEKARRMEYDLNSETRIIVEREGDNFKAREEKIPYEVAEAVIEGKIDEFLYKDALDAGLSEATILEIADIFSFDIDFTTDIREGDQFKVFYEKRTLGGEKAPDGRILAAKFINAGQEYRAYYFESGGEGSYYDGEGRELERQFLRAPLSYRRITSGYTGARLHPITKTVSAHYQIDYAAPAGTPVSATARGTVASAGWEGGWGNMVRLRHDNGYTTHYGHLSAFAKGVKAGVGVSQGQVIGYVGSTGWSTGPHLDYGMRLNGSPVNPMSLQLPKGVPLSGDALSGFNEEKKKLDEKLD